jgi:hypothetical protein
LTFSNDPFYPKDYKLNNNYKRDIYIHGNLNNLIPPIQLNYLEILRITNRLIIFNDSKTNNNFIINFLNERYKKHYKIIDSGIIYLNLFR